MNERELKFDTLQIHAGQVPDPTTGSRAVPIYQTSSFVFNDINHAANLFAAKEKGNIYTRMSNPTTDVFEKRMAALEGGVSALAVASGSSAITYSILNIANAGDEFVAASNIYGGTYNMFAVTLPKLGVKAAFVDPDDPESFRRAINEKTKAIFIEIIGNPGMNIIDIEAVANIAHENNIPLIIDNTFGTPYLIKPIEFGADIVVHSAAKFICGHGTTIAGVIVDSGNFNWAKGGKFPCLSEPDNAYNGINYVETYGKDAYMAKLRAQFLRDIGACISPFSSFLMLQGLETLSLRVAKHVENAMKIATFLESHPLVSWVNYPGLKSSRYYDMAQKYLPKGAGSIFTFGIKGGVEEGRTFIENLKIFSLVANVGDAKSMITLPAGTTHSQLSEEEQKAMGVTPDMIRVSVGIEDVEDLIYDIDQALKIAVKELSCNAVDA